MKNINIKTIMIDNDRKIENTKAYKNKTDKTGS